MRFRCKPRSTSNGLCSLRACQTANAQEGNLPNAAVTSTEVWAAANGRLAIRASLVELCQRPVAARQLQRLRQLQCLRQVRLLQQQRVAAVHPCCKRSIIAKLVHTILGNTRRSNIAARSWQALPQDATWSTQTQLGQHVAACSNRLRLQQGAAHLCCNIQSQVGAWSARQLARPLLQL